MDRSNAGRRPGICLQGRASQAVSSNLGHSPRDFQHAALILCDAQSTGARWRLTQTAHDLLVALLNLDAEIKYRMARLAQLHCKTDEPVTPGREDARGDLLGELAVLQARREECFLKLNGVRREPSSGSPPRADPLPEQTGTRTGPFDRTGWAVVGTAHRILRVVWLP